MLCRRDWTRAQRLLQLFGRGGQVLHELLVTAGVELRVLLGEALQQEIHDLLVPLRAAQPVVAIHADDLHVVALEPHDRGVERPATEVVDEDVPGRRVLADRLVGQRGGYWLGQHVQHVQPGDLPGPPGGLPFLQAEVRGHGDNHVLDTARRSALPPGWPAHEESARRRIPG